MTETQLSPAEFQERRKSRHHWYGYLADENVEHVADRIRTMLGGSTYTFVANNVEQKSAVPEVRTSQRLTPEKTLSKQSPRVSRIGDEQNFGGETTISDWCGISCADTYGSWGIHAPHTTEAEARADERHSTFLSIYGGLGENGSRERIEIHHRNGYGEMLHWVIAVEQVSA